MIGFDTIGNATIIAYDDQPILATDPWISGGAYFGSWGFSHAIPGEQLESIKACPYLWFSHGHPDHLHMESISDLQNKQILLANHAGGRIARDLKGMGFNVRVLPEREWVSLSKRVRIMTISDYNQDSILLVDVGGTLLINLNDANDRGWGAFVKNIARQFRTSYLLKLSCYGDADMINLFDEDGYRVRPGAAEKPALGPRLARWARVFGATHIIPFSSFHRYQREDSSWANEYVTPLSAYLEKFDAPELTMLPAFSRVNCETGVATPLNPPLNENNIRPASDFGDNWAEPLEKSERDELTRYFQAKTTLRSQLGFLRFVVGGQETTVDINPKLKPFGITFNVPRCSLMTAVRYQIFDDLLIGNFMRTTLHGGAKLYPHFTPLVAKYSDNGQASTSAGLRQYFFEYFKRDPMGLLQHWMELKSEDVFRKLVPMRSGPYQHAQRLYWKAKRFI